MTIQFYNSGGRFEEIGSYSRAKRVGPFVYVAGTTAIEPSGKLHAPGDTYAQSVYIFNKIELALNELGAEMRHVVRTRCYLTDISEAGGLVKAHGEVFKGIFPVTTGVEAGLTQPGMMVEIDVDAIIHDPAGKIEI
ncbi:Rid family hydrolase [Granulosicoccus sp.]|jgi:enamine deaminase RidA (YjgF/YER057c/UK114 family)|nr:Rid family hydrolase [Granulosicoccus sp.]MDB4223232.1 Rid family hydrolase [Granulosicoccus sp.]